MTRIAIVGAALALPDRMQPDGVLVVEEGRVAAAGSRSAVPIPRGAARVDARGFVLAPGFVDLHVNGFGGVDCFGAGKDDLARMGRSLVATGVTSFFPTLVTSPFPALCRALAQLADGVEAKPVAGSAEAAGVYLEGPFLADGARGAHPSQDLRAPRAETVRQLLELKGSKPWIVAISPELPGAFDAIRTFARKGVVVALGHSVADAESCRLAVAAGARHVTHLYNAMGPIHHRLPGLAGFALGSGMVTAELIADGHHVDRWMVATAWRAIGADRLALVSDALAPAGLPLADGAGYRLESGLGRVTVRRAPADRVSPAAAAAPVAVAANGKLAGSLASLADGVRFAVHAAGIPLHDALRMASATPARIGGIANRKGSLIPGLDADLVLLDGGLEVRSVWVRGRPVEPIAPATGRQPPRARRRAAR